MKDKTITRTYRNGKSVFQQEYIIRLKSNVVGNKFIVTEQRAKFKDEKPIFTGSEADAEKAYANAITCTIVNGEVLPGRV